MSYLLNKSKADIMKSTAKHIRVIPRQTAQAHETLNFLFPVGRDRIYYCYMGIIKSG